MDKTLILNEIKSYLNIDKNIDFAEFLGIKPTTLAMWYKRNTFDIELLFKKCEVIDANWLLTGEGSMLKEPCPAVVSSSPPQENAQYTALLEKITTLQEQVISLMQENKRLAEENSAFQRRIQNRATG